MVFEMVTCWGSGSIMVLGAVDDSIIVFLPMWLVLVVMMVV